MTTNAVGTAAITRALVAVGMLVVATSAVHAAADSSSSTACAALASSDFSNLQDAPTQVMEAGVVAAVGEVPAHCHVQGYVAPQVGFELQLPASGWNGKFVEIGCGGWCGSTRTKGKLYLGWCDDVLRRGYACIVSNQGHTSSREGHGSQAGADGLWASNNLQAEIDYGFRAAHVVALAGKAITHQYYRTRPNLSYFMGCSGGGRQALVEAQRFPWDFDGIIAIDPSYVMSTNMTRLWNQLATRGEDGKPLLTAADRDVLHDAVLNRCDLDDGVRDGVVSAPLACEFDPAELTCQAGRQSGCLSSAQVAAVKKVYSGPTTSSGERLFYGAMPGSERGASFSAQGASFTAEEGFFRYMAFMPDPPPGWKVSGFDFDRDYRRLGMMEAIYAHDNPDLRRFKAAGGKLILAQGWDNSGSPAPRKTIDYYETVERVMGGRDNTQDFARLFMMPGREHCAGGPGANAIDFISYLEAWVERDAAPEFMIGAHIDAEEKIKSGDVSDFVRLPKDPSQSKFTRPIYRYPTQARYSGKGDPNDYRNFVPVEPARE